MKRKLFIGVVVCIVSCLGTQVVKAQKLEAGVNGNYLSVNPVGLFVKSRVQYEWQQKEKVGLGFTMSLHYRLFEGIRAELFTRRYFAPSPGGRSMVYLQLKAGYGRFISELNTEVTDVNGNRVNHVFDVPFQSINTGVGAGLKLFFDQQHRWVFDACLGFQYAPWRPNPQKREMFERRIGPVTDGIVWHLIGPGALIQPSIMLGYRF